MKTRLLVLVIVLLTLGLTLTGAALAQGPDPRIPAQASYGPPQPDAVPAWDEMKPGAHARPAPVNPSTGARPANAPAVNLGQPGLSFRYVRTFGETEVPYFDDPNHLFVPTGIAADGNNLWVAENVGRRALKYKSDGTFLMQFGKAGFREFAGTTLSGMSDVAVDKDGNVWVTDFSHHAVKFDPTGTRLQELGQTWNSGAANDRFNNPYGIAFDSVGNIYVSDSNNHRIQVFDGGGTYRVTVGVTGVSGSDNAHFKYPRHITIDTNNRLYVADTDNHRVQIFDVSNVGSITYLATLGVSAVSGSDNAHLNSPCGAVADIAMGRIYVADGYNWRVQVFDYGTRAYLRTVMDTSFTEDVAVDSDSNLYLAKSWTERDVVRQYNRDLNFVRNFGAYGVPYLTDGYHYNRPAAVAVAPDGSIYIGENEGRRLIKLNAAGSPEWIKGQAGYWGSDNDHFSYVDDVALDGAGRVYAVDTANHRVQIFLSDGSYYATLGGSQGTGNNQLNRPQGVAVAPNGTIYVADTSNHRVQVFDSNRNYLATLGQSGVSGSDNAHFNWPLDVEVDSARNIYVADHNNHRVQVLNQGGAWMRTIGESGTAGDDFGHLRNPTAVTLDSAGRTYVADSWGGRVHVYDSNGAYLTTIGNSWGNRTGQMRDALGVAVDKSGNLYVSESENHRIQKFAPGVPGWRQVNINGFGEQRAGWISTLLPFQGSLYAAGYPKAYVRRMLPDGVWSSVNADGFGDPTNQEVDAMAEFNSQLYAATYTWVCDDANCSTGHTNGPQIWRSPNGTTWQNVTPVAGFGAGSIYIDTFAVFDGQLYAAVYAGAARGAEIWRTADGTGWTRVAANGFDDDLYNTDVLTLAVYNGQLYAGTRHGDWYNDGHADGPLGGEVWRSADGEHWSQANNPGFGLPEAHRVERLMVFKDALYAYVSHTGGSAWGADVWRCATAICAAQGDWAKVADNGFGVPQNQYLYSGVTAGDYLYAAAQNGITGVQLWRTADGSHWEKATPYDGLGDSNSTYVYFAAMTVHEGKLFIGPTNWANGGEAWMKTLTADFTATPARGAPPLTVQFANTSAGDFTTSQWDFGDGGTSTATSPTHTYTASGTYTVRLTVGDGTDTSAITKENAIRVGYATHLPLVTRNYDPLLYDNFDDPTWNGAYNPAKWQSDGDTSDQFRQQSGSLVVTNLPTSNPSGASLVVQRPRLHRWQQVQQAQARLKMNSDRSGGWSPVGIALTADETNGHGWFAHCSLGANGSMSQASFGCSVFISQGGSYPTEYRTLGVSVDYNTWHTARIETDPNTANVRFYLDDTLIGSHIPNDATALLASDQVRVAITVWGAEPNSSATRYVDDVRITPAQ